MYNVRHWTFIQDEIVIYTLRQSLPVKRIRSFFFFVNRLTALKKLANSFLNYAAVI